MRLEIGDNLRIAVRTIMETVEELNSHISTAASEHRPGVVLQQAFGIDFAKIVAAASRKAGNLDITVNTPQSEIPVEKPSGESMPEITLEGKRDD